MPPPLKTFTVGEEILGWPVNTWNALIREAMQSEKERANPVPPQIIRETPKVDTLVNTTAFNFNLFHVVEIAGPVNKNVAALQLQSPTTFEVKKPSGDGVRFGVAQGPLPAGGACDGVTDSWSWVKVDVKNETHTTAGVKSGVTTHLDSGIAGSTILWKEKAQQVVKTGVQWALVHLGDAATSDQMLIVTPLVDIAAGTEDFPALVEEVVRGEEPDAIINVRNVFHEAFKGTAKIPVWKHKEDDDYIPDRGSGTGFELLRFELVEDLLLEQANARAEVLDDDGNWSGEEIRVYDAEKRFSGYAALVDEESAEIQPGYRGLAFFFRDPGGFANRSFRILTMEGPARFLRCKLAKSFGANADEGEAELLDWWGASPNNRKPYVTEKEYGAGTSEDPKRKKYVVAFTDPFEYVTTSLAEGTSISLTWNERQRRYVLDPVLSGMLRIRGKSTDGAGQGSTQITLTDVAVVSGALPQGVELPSTIKARIHDHAPVNVPSETPNLYAVQDLEAGSTIGDQWSFGDGENHLWHLRGHQGWSDEDFRVLCDDRGTVAYKSVEDVLEELGGWTASGYKSIYGDPGARPKWQSDEECPEEP